MALAIGMSIGAATMENIMEAPQKNGNELSHDITIPLMDISKENENINSKYMHPVFIVALLTIKLKVLKQLKCLHQWKNG